MIKVMKSRFLVGVARSVIWHARLSLTLTYLTSECHFKSEDPHPGHPPFRPPTPKMTMSKKRSQRL